MLNELDLSRVKKLVDEFQPGVTDFERLILTPAVLGRLIYVKSICEKLKTVCLDTSVAVQIDEAVRRVANPEALNINLPEPRLGQQYLNSISQMLDQDYINIINQLLNQFPENELNTNFKKLSEFYNRTVNLLQTFIGLEHSLFQASFKILINMRHRQTGNVLLGTPTEVSIILIPFQNYLFELVNVSKTTIESITEWSKQIKAQKQNHIEMIVSLSQVKAAEEQSRAAKYNLAFQIAVIIFTVALVILGYWVNLYMEKRNIESALTKSEEAAEKCNQITVRLNNESLALKEAINSCKAIKPPSRNK